MAQHDTRRPGVHLWGVKRNILTPFIDSVETPNVKNPKTNGGINSALSAARRRCQIESGGLDVCRGSWLNESAGVSVLPSLPPGVGDGGRAVSGARFCVY